MVEMLIKSLETAKRVVHLKGYGEDSGCRYYSTRKSRRSHPSEVKLAYDTTVYLGREAKKAGLLLKQNYRFVAKELLIKRNGY